MKLSFGVRAAADDEPSHPMMLKQRRPVPHEQRRDWPKAIVIGDYQIIEDDVVLSRELSSLQQVTNHYELFRSSLEWLLDRKLPVFPAASLAVA